eukprot:2576489-Rhodomonas_salina.2
MAYRVGDMLACRESYKRNRYDDTNIDVAGRDHAESTRVESRALLGSTSSTLLPSGWLRQIPLF